MIKHYAQAQWEGNLTGGKGKYTLKTSGLEGNVNFSSRFEDNKSASSPEELIGAALATCFSMAFANALDKAGNKPEKIETSAEVTLTKGSEGFSITEILLRTKGTVHGIEKQKFMTIAEDSKKNCPVSRALTGTNVRLEAELV
jgi:osmotically inducible protein OsmC